jgi:hypothetical protein
MTGAGNPVQWEASLGGFTSGHCLALSGRVFLASGMEKGQTRLSPA